MNNCNRKKRNHSKNIVFIAFALFCMVAALAGCRGKTGTSANANTSEAVVSQTDDIREADASSQAGIVTDKPAAGDESKQPNRRQKKKMRQIRQLMSRSHQKKKRQAQRLTNQNRQKIKRQIRFRMMN